MHERPDHRYQKVLEAIEASDATSLDPISAELFSLAGDGKTVSKIVSATYDLFLEQEHRVVLDAFLLTKCTIAEISGLFEIPPEVIETYAFLFMDTAVFANKLEILSFAASYDSSAHGKELIKTAVNVGPDYLFWTYGKPRDNFDPRTIIHRTMMDAFFRGTAHKGNSLTTGVAKEAHHWWKTAISNAMLSEKLNPSSAKQAIQELRIALGQVDDTVAADQFEVPISEILH